MICLKKVYVSPKLESSDKISFCAEVCDILTEKKRILRKSDRKTLDKSKC